jgi:uncharacterized tellurite resistance protein B-like protein
MANENLTMGLAKLLIAAAWVDGKLQNEEINALKDLIFTLGDISAEQRAHLEIYMDSPVSEKERRTLLDNVLAETKTADDKEFVLKSLRELFCADGIIDDKEMPVLDEFTQAVSGVRTDVFSRLSKMLTPAINRRQNAYKSGSQREGRIDDFIKNTIYYQLEFEGKVPADLGADKVRQLCLAAGLLARVANIDEDISAAERDAIKGVLSRSWGLSEQEARVVTDISCHKILKGLDYFRLTRGFFECTTLDQRRSFLVCLFKVANASDKVSNDEIEEIRKISDALKLTHKDFIAAKLTISDEDLGLC